jgi:hypothetical protein
VQERAERCGTPPIAGLSLQVGRRNQTLKACLLERSLELAGPGRRGQVE